MAFTPKEMHALQSPTTQGVSTDCVQELQVPSELGTGGSLHMRGPRSCSPTEYPFGQSEQGTTRKESPAAPPSLPGFLWPHQRTSEASFPRRFTLSKGFKSVLVQLPICHG